MADDDSDPEPGKSISSLVRLDVGGTHYTTTVDTLTQRDSTSMLGVMFSGRHRVHRDPKKGTVFIDRDGTHFRHILNWLRDGCVPVLEGQIHQELVREAEYYQLQDMLEAMAKAHHLKELDSHLLPELTRQEVIKCLQNKRVRLRGVNLCGVNLSGLDMSGVDLSYAKLCGTSFQTAVLQCAIFKYAEADESNCSNAVFKECDFKGASLRKAVLAGTNLQSANLQDVNLSGATLCGADLQSAHLQNADLTDADLTGANLEGANLKFMNGVGRQRRSKGRSFRGRICKGPICVTSTFATQSWREPNLGEQTCRELPDDSITEWRAVQAVSPGSRQDTYHQGS
eukprot:SM000097S24814  [mRNA]  locus=s97:498865:502511:+ [translate_table: standard]